MVELKSINFINEYDIMELTGRTADYFGFLCDADDNSYVPLKCGDEALTRLWEDYEYELRHDEEYVETHISDPDERAYFMAEESGSACVMAHIKLVEALRAMGVRDEILVYVSW